MRIVLVSWGVVLASVVAGAGISPSTAAPAAGHVVVVQAVPGAEVGVSIDGRSVERKADVGSLSQPIELAVGSHDLVFTGVPRTGRVTTRLDVKSGSSTDVVLHQPASVNGDPVVSTYRTPLSPIGPEKARVLLAHTATVAPADVRVDGKVVFTNIANGEYADADVPAGPHRVALLPTGTTTDPLLGPLTLTLAPRTVTMVYAVGSPRNGSMDAIVHEVPVRSDGTAAPESIDTGSAGRAAGVEVVPFDSGAAAGGRGDRPARSLLPWFRHGLVGLLVAPPRVPSSSVRATPARRAGAVRPERPRSVRLPDGVVVPIRAVSTRRDGSLDVPDDISTAGWWRGGSRLGDGWGSTLVAAHVDSTTQGLGPYAGLLAVRPGQRFVLASATRRQVFRATSLRLVPRARFAREHSLSSSTGARRLVLVTCAPPFVPANGGYQNLAVVSAAPASPPTPRGTR